MFGETDLVSRKGLKRSDERFELNIYKEMKEELTWIRGIAFALGTANGGL